MLCLCREDSPAGFDPSKDKFGHCWVQKFMHRKDLGLRRATNIKKDSVFEKLHKVHRYHWTQFRLGDNPISSERGCSDDENFDNCLDAAAEPEDESSSSEEESSTEESS